MAAGRPLRGDDGLRDQLPLFQKQRNDAAASLHQRFSGKAKPLRSPGEVDDADAEDRLVDAHPDITVNKDNRPKDA